MTRFDPCRKRVCFRRFHGWKLKTATCAALNSIARERALLLFFCILLSGCREKANGELLGQQMKLVATDVTVVVLKDTGHWVLEEKLKETTDALIKFL